MKPTKQTVYLREIHYNDWLVKSYSDDLIDTVKQSEGYFFTAEQLNEYTANVIKQALENAAEKSTLEHREYKLTGEYNSENMGEEVCIDHQEPYRNYLCVDKQSITNTFEEIYLNFKI